MRQAIHHFSISTKGRGLVEMTPLVAGWVARQEIATVLLTLFCRHTSASLLIQENADPAVRTDLAAWFAAAAPEDPDRYVHTTEGPDDMPAHIRTALTQTHLAIPVEDGRMVLGTWQGVYLFEHRASPHSRHLVLHYLGD